MFPALIEKLGRREDLRIDEASSAMEEIMAGRATSAQIAGFLVGLSMKGERATEIVGLAQTMRANAVPLSTSRPGLFDTCGTGGDGSSTFNVSSLAALVLAGCGGTITKHGNRAVLLFYTRRNFIPQCAMRDRPGGSWGCGPRLTYSDRLRIQPALPISWLECPGLSIPT